MWWRMVLADDIAISTTPSWLCDSSDSSDGCCEQQGSSQPQFVWREHWLPMLYLFPTPITPAARGLEGDATTSTTQTRDGSSTTADNETPAAVHVAMHHDDFGIAFTASAEGPSAPAVLPKRVTAPHALLPRDRIAALNNARRSSTMAASLRAVFAQHSSSSSGGSSSSSSNNNNDDDDDDSPRPCLHRALCFGSVNVAALALRAMSMCPSAPAAFDVVEHQTTARITRAIVQRHGMQGVHMHASVSEAAGRDTQVQVDAIVAEPFYLDAIEPWQGALRFAQDIARACSHSGLISRDAAVWPRQSVLCCAAVQFEHLHTIRHRVGKVVLGGFLGGLFVWVFHLHCGVVCAVCMCRCHVCDVWCLV